MSKKLFTGTLSNGTPIELLEAESFTGKTEFAVQVAGKIVSVSSVAILRSGDVQIKTTANAVRIKSDKKDSPADAKSGPTLNDVKS